MRVRLDPIPQRDGHAEGQTDETGKTISRALCVLTRGKFVAAAAAAAAAAATVAGADDDNKLPMTTMSSAAKKISSAATLTRSARDAGGRRTSSSAQRQYGVAAISERRSRVMQLVFVKRTGA